MKIEGIILDIDGVIVGEKIGFNSPEPHPDVIRKLQSTRSKGIQISLCTAKPHFSIDGIVKKAKLDNYHIADGGGVIINPIDGKVVEKHIIDSNVAHDLIEAFIRNRVYTEFYSVDNYYIQESQISNITKQHKYILQRNPVVIKSLDQEALSFEVTKIMPIAVNEKDKKRLEDIFEPFVGKLTLFWGVHPVALPLQFGIITAPGVSKKQGAVSIMKNFQVPFGKILGVGDSLSDWQFIEMCGFGAAMGNAKQELKDLVLSKGKGFSYVGRSVDENGIIDVLDNFITD